MSDVPDDEAPREAADGPPDGISFDPQWYCMAYPDVVAASLDPFVHYADHGRAEGRLPCSEMRVIRASGLLDCNYYIMNSEDVRRAKLDPYDHFLRYGSAELRRPNPYFDPTWYREHYGSPPHCGPLAHYVLWGEARGHRPGLLFDPVWYRRTYSIPADANALAHYLAHRASQQVSPVPWFDVSFYVERNRATIRPGRDPFGHYLALGAARDANPSAWFDAAEYRRNRMAGDAGREVPLLHFLRETISTAPSVPTSPADRNRPTPPAASSPRPAAVPKPAEFEAAAVLLASPFIDRAHFRKALGAEVGDRDAVAAYLSRAPADRPRLTPYLDPVWYVTCHRGAFEEEPDPLLHFLRIGAARHLSPHPLIDLEGLVARRPESFAGRPVHEALAGLLEDLDIDPGPYFSREHYLSQVEGDLEAASAPLRHFLLEGIERNLAPNRFLDLPWYRVSRDIGVQSNAAALRRFVAFGDPGGESPGPQFDSAWYLRRYPDVRENALPALRHYLEHGLAENRQRAPVNQRSAGRFERHGSAPELGLVRYREIAAAARDRSGQSRRMRAPATTALRQTASAAQTDPVPIADIRITVVIPAPKDQVGRLRRTRASVQDRLARDVAPSAIDVRLPKAGKLEEAFSAPTGQFVLILSADRELDRHALSRLVACLQSDDRVDVAGATLVGPHGLVEESGRSIDNRGRIDPIADGLDPQSLAMERTRDVHAVSHEAVLIRGTALADGWPGQDASAIVNLCLTVHARRRRVCCVGSARAHRIASAALTDSVDPHREGTDGDTVALARQAQDVVRRWGDLLVRLNQVRVLAFYLPQYHRTELNDLWWGRGFTDWTNVSRAEPSYEGHYQPHVPADLGYYDLRIGSVFAEQAALAARYGIDGFCVYRYCLNGQRLLHEPFEAMLRNKSIRFPFCVAWANENWTRNWDGGDGEMLAPQLYDEATISIVIEDAIRLARDPRYIAVGGKPVFAIYRPLKLPDPNAFAGECRRRFAAAGLPGVHLIGMESMEASAGGLDPASIGFDAAVEFPPQGRNMLASDRPRVMNDEWTGTRFDYAKTVLAFTREQIANHPRHPAVFPSWDNTPRQPREGISFDGADPAIFQFYVEQKLTELHRSALGGERLLFINAWNEWAEGAHLEPDQAYGHRWLEAVRAARDTTGFRAS